MNTIIVVDDDSTIRSILHYHLLTLGYDVIEHDSGIGVDTLIQQHHPIACMIDIVMHDKNGADVIREIAAWPSRPKLIAISADTSFLELADMFGSDAVLSKPVRAGCIKQTLDRIFDQTTEAYPAVPFVQGENHNRTMAR